MATVALGLAAIYLLPSDDRPSQPSALESPVVAGTEAEPAVPPSVAPAATTPIWDDPALLETRAAAQALQKKIDQQATQLRGKGVERWAGEPFASAVAHAETAAKAFASRDFAAARSGYEAAAATLDTLIGEVPGRLSEALRAGQKSLAEADKARAQGAFDLALALDPGNAAAIRGLERLKSLDAVAVKLQTARRLEQANDVAGAESAYRAALQLDADTEEAKTAVARIQSARVDEEFRRDLGEALEALDRNNLGVAAARIARAQALRPGDGGVQQAASRLAEARRGGRLSQLQQEAQAQAAAEDWAGAEKTYQAALEIDPSVAFAREGLTVAEPRARLSAKMQDLINRPQRLTSLAVAEEADALILEAQATANPGPRLAEQIAGLRLALDQAAQPVVLQLRSDDQTDVTVYRVGPLGRFATHDLELKPGRYVAIGTRPGYRDVRREFEISAGSTRPVVEVRCEETL
ncbi:MAG: hypothetical protein ACT4QA_00810 [Panacagrimonas sp.]